MTLTLSDMPPSERALFEAIEKWNHARESWFHAGPAFSAGKVSAREIERTRKAVDDAWDAVKAAASM